MKHDWFYMKGAEKHGPVSSQRLKELTASGQLLPTDLVWREGMRDWKRARKIDGLFDKTANEADQPDGSHPSSSTPSKKRPPAPPSNLLGGTNRPSPPPSNLVGNTAAKPVNPPANTKPSTNSNPATPTQSPASSPPPVAAPSGPDGIFRCPQCRREISDDPSASGEVVGCPHCGGEFRMPVAKQVAPQPYSCIQTSPQIGRGTTSPTSQKKKIPWRIARRATPTIGCLVMFLCCGGFGIIVSLQDAAHHRHPGADRYADLDELNRDFDEVFTTLPRWLAPHYNGAAIELNWPSVVSFRGGGPDGMQKIVVGTTGEDLVTLYVEYPDRHLEKLTADRLFEDSAESAEFRYQMHPNMKELRMLDGVWRVTYHVWNAEDSFKLRLQDGENRVTRIK